MTRITATEFKARCLSLLDEVAHSGEPLEIVKRGKPVAHVVPALTGETAHPQDALRGTVRVYGDIVAPVGPASDWEAQAP